MDVNIDDIRLVPPLSVLTLALAQFSEFRDKSNDIKYLWPRRLIFYRLIQSFIGQTMCWWTILTKTDNRGRYFPTVAQPTRMAAISLCAACWLGSVRREQRQLFEVF